MLTTYPKAVRVIFKTVVPHTAPDILIQAVVEKADEFYYDQKGDLYVNYIDQYTIERYFADNNAAQEWADFIKFESDKNNFEITDIKIIDV